MWVGGAPTSSANRAICLATAAGTSPVSSGSSSRWSPRLSAGHSRARATASWHAGRLTIRLALVSIPSRWAWMIPRVTPRCRPNPYPVTMSHFLISPRSRGHATCAGRPARADVQRLLQDAADNGAAVEVVLGELARKPGVALIIWLDGGKCLDCLVEILEA